MNILITGSSGFIGKNIAAALSGEHTLLTPTHQQLDLMDEEKVLVYLRRHPIDIVIHCAVIGGNRKDQYVDKMFYDNLRIFLNIVRCEKYFSGMINIGSGAEYDKRFPVKEVKEEALGTHIPDDEYGLYKYICAQFILTSKKITDLRVFGIFGEGEDYRFRFISNAICRYIHHMPITMTQNVYFDYMYIGDFVNVVKYFVAHRPAHRAYNIGSGKKVSLLSLAKYINTLDRYRVKILVKKPGLNNEYTGNVRRLYKELPMAELTPIRESIKSLFHWYKENIHIIKHADL